MAGKHSQNESNSELPAHLKEENPASEVAGYNKCATRAQLL
jgi:hypothetical protein